MPKDTLTDIIAELTEVEAKLKAQIEKLFGKIDTTDLSDEYALLEDALAKLKAFTAPTHEAPVPPAVSVK